MRRDRQPMIIETMTLNEAVDALRGLGVKTSPERVGSMLEAGLYPWGVSVRGKGGSRTVEIYAKLFWEWVDRVAEPDTDYLEAEKKTAQRLAPLDCPRPDGRALKA